MTTREHVIAEARTWLGTPYHHHAAVKGAGVDCAHLLIEVYHAVGLVPKLDVGEYSTQWHLHRGEEKFLGWIEQHAVRVAAPRPGDVAVWQFGRTFSHGGIVVSDVDVIHALRDARCVTITAMRDQPLADRPVQYYTLFGG
jgi:cell wall-associated NlpC family hydrolase